MNTCLLHDARLSFRECDVTPALILNKLDLDLPPSRLLVRRLGRAVVVVVVAAALHGVAVSDEAVVGEGALAE